MYVHILKLQIVEGRLAREAGSISGGPCTRSLEEIGGRLAGREGSRRVFCTSGRHMKSRMSSSLLDQVSPSLGSIVLQEEM